MAIYDGSRKVRDGALNLGRSLAFDRGEIALLPDLEHFQVLLEVRLPSGKIAMTRLTSDNPASSLPGRGDLAVVVERFSPDASISAGGWVTGGPELRSPLVAVRIVGSGAETLTRADLRPGESMSAQGFTVTFGEAVYMPAVIISSRAGATVVLAGIVAHLLGVVMSLAFSFRQLFVGGNAEGSEVTGFSRRRNQPLAEEMRSLGLGGER